MSKDMNFGRMFMTVVLVGFFSSIVAAEVIVDDTFDVGAATFDDDPDDPFDVAWSSGFVADDGGLLIGNALLTGGDVFAEFDPVTLEAEGDLVRLSFDFRFDGPVGAGGNSGNGNFLFRVGLTDQASEKTGYIIRIGTGGDGVTPGIDGNGIGLRQNDDRAGPYDVDGRGVPVQDDTFSIFDNDPHSASLTITLTTVETTFDGDPTGPTEGVRLDGTVDDVNVSGVFPFFVGPIIDLVALDHIYFDDRGPDFVIDNVIVEFGVEGADRDVLQAGDADQDWDFDQLDLVKVQIAAKYLTGQAATWGEGDWDGAPGGEPGSPPVGNGLFDQLDIISALAPGRYLTGPYASIGKGGTPGDGQTSIVYNPSTGELAVDAPAGPELTSINIDSAGSIFTGDAAQNLGGSFDNDADNNIFKATFGSSFGSLSFGKVAQAGLSEEFVLNDLTVVGSLNGGGDLDNVDLIYIPEPSAIALATVGLLSVVVAWRRRPRI